MSARDHKLTVRKRLFLSYMLLFTIPLLFMCLLLYVTMYRNIVSDAHASRINVLKNVARTVDNQFANLNQLSIQLSYTSWVNKIAYMQGNQVDYERVDVFMRKEYSEQFVNFKAINDMIAEISLYFEGKNLVISSLGVHDYNGFESNIFHTEEQDLSALLADIKPPALVNLHISTYGHIRKGFLYTQAVPIYGPQQKVMLMVFIEEKSFRELLNPLLQADADVVAITGPNGETLYSYHTNDTSRSSKWFEYRSDLMGWTFAIEVPKRELMAGTASLTMNIVLLALLCGLVGWLLSAKLANNGYRPLAKLITFIQERSGETSVSRRNEYDWLENTMRALYVQEEQFNSRLAEQQPILRDAYLKRLLEGSFEINAEFSKALALLDYTFPHPYYASVLIQGCDATPSAKEIIRGYAESYGVTVYTTHDVEYMLMACNYAERPAFHDFIERLAINPGFRISAEYAVASGAEGASLHALASSIQQARVAIEYRHLHADRTLFRFEDVNENERSYLFPPDQEYVLSNLIKSGDFDGAEALYSNIWKANLDKVNISPAALRNFMVHMELTLIKILQETGIEAEVSAIPQAVLDYQSIGESNAYLRELCRTICERIRSRLDMKDNYLKVKVLRYINDHLTDPSLCLTMVADHLGISSSYLSRFFKEQIGCNFLDYLSRERIRIARRLLSDGSIEIKAISRMVGYENDETFRRLFKKYEGMAPSQFRSIEQGESSFSDGIQAVTVQHYKI